jgi:type I restriction enzyme S subunit
MSFEGQEIKLADVIEIIGGGTPKTSVTEYWGGSIPWLSVRDFNNVPRYVEFAEKGITKKGLKNSSTKLLNVGDLIISARGTVGALAQLKRPMAFNQSCYGIRGIANTSNTDFIFYVLKVEIEQLKRLAHGGVFDTITRDTFKNISIFLPSFYEQTLIANFLGALDDRITLLRETNTTLEAIAKALFKSWFVDFDPVRAKYEGKLPEGMDEAIAALFPNTFEETELRTLPKGWRQIKLSEICKVHRGCSYKGAGLSEDSGAYMFNLGCFNAPRVFALDKVKRYTGEYKDHHSVSAGDLIVANTDITQHRTILGRPLIVPTGFQKSFISHHVFRLELFNSEKSSMRNFLFFEFQQPEFRKRAIGYATGTTVLALSKDVLEGLGLTKPTDQVLEKFNQIVTPLLDSILKNERQVQTLIKIRNTLLPRLISGQLRIGDVKGEHEMVSA